MQVGGRNLLKNTASGVDWSKTDFDAETRTFTRATTSTSESFIVLTNQTRLENDTTYTLSAWIRSNGQVKDVDYYVYNKGATKTHSRQGIAVTTDWQFVTFTFTTDSSADYSESTIRFDNNGSKTAGVNAILYVKDIKLEKGNKATDWTPAPEDYEVTEVVSGADLAEGMTKFNASYAFKLLDDSEWVTKKLVCPENCIQLFWGEPRSATRFSFWFEIKEIEKVAKRGGVEHDRELRRVGVNERRKDITRYRFPKTN